MKSNSLLLFACLGLLTGCGPSKAERDARERERLRLEKQTQQDAQKANQAITDINKKMFGSKTPPPPEPAKKP